MSGGRCVMLALAGAMAAAEPAAQAPPAARTESVVFDRAAAETLRSQADFTGVVIVEAVNPDAAHFRRRSLEQVFAEGLNPPARAWHRGILAPVAATPCPSLASMQTSVGTGYNPYGFCP
jgi:hypothetical protein